MIKYQIALSCPTFQRNLKKLQKKYKRIKKDIAELFTLLEQGKKRAIALPKFDNKVFKVRQALKTEKLGEDSGLRLIYFLDQQKKEIVPLILYYKGDKENVSDEELLNAIKDIGHDSGEDKS